MISLISQQQDTQQRGLRSGQGEKVKLLLNWEFLNKDQAVKTKL